MQDRNKIWGFGGFLTRLALLAGLLMAVVASPAVKAQPGPPGPSVSDPAVQAHRSIDTAKLEVRFSTYYCYPDETEFITANYSLVLDRPNNRLRIDRPGFTVICDGKDIVVTAAALPGRHLRLPAPSPLTYETLIKELPDLEHPTAPGLIMLLSNTPMSILSDGQANDATSLGPVKLSGKTLNQLKLPMQLGDCVLSCAQNTNLLDQVLIEVDPKNLQNAPVDAVRFHYAMTWSEVGKPVEDKLFEFDLKKSHEMTSMAQFLSNGGVAAPGTVPQGHGQPGQGAPPPNPPPSPPNTIVGMPLPDLDLAVLGQDKTINLFNQDKGVVIVEFYASWTKVSALDLPRLSDFDSWAKEQGTPVKVFAVAVGETKQSMTPWIDALEKTAKQKIEYPILLDSEMKAAMAMKLPTVPRTIIAVDGRVVDVYGGTKPSFLDDLKKGLPEWKIKSESAGDAKENTPQPKPNEEVGESKPEQSVEPVKPEVVEKADPVEQPVAGPRSPKKAPRAPR